MTRYQKFSFLFVTALALCLSVTSDVNASLLEDGVIKQYIQSGACATGGFSATTSTAFIVSGTGNTGSSICYRYLYDSTYSATNGKTLAFTASTTAWKTGTAPATSCQVRFIKDTGSGGSVTGNSTSFNTATVQLGDGNNVYRTYNGTQSAVVGEDDMYLGVMIRANDPDVNCVTEITSVTLDGVEILVVPPPTPTTPVPMEVFEENFDGASTTAGTNLVDTWGQVGWLQTSSGVGSYTVTATSSAPSSPNIIYSTGSKTTGFYVATSSKIQFGGMLNIGGASDIDFALYAEGVAGTNFTGTSTLNMTVCTRTSCGLGTPQVSISSTGNFFGCTASQEISAYTGNSWVPFEFFYDADNGSIQFILDDVDYGAICEVRDEVNAPIIAFDSGALDDLWLATDGYIYVPPVPTWGLGTTTVYGYSDFYETRFTGVTVTPSGTSSADFNISYYIDAQEIVPNVLERYPELITVRYSVGTSSIVAGQSGTVATSTLISGGYATTTIDVTDLADGTYIANIQFDNYACASRRAGLTLSDGIPVCPFPLAQANVTFLMISGVPYVSEVSLVDNSPNINDETGEEETTDLMKVFTRFFVEVFTEKHPFAWYNDFLQLVQEASQVEYETEDLEFSIPIFVAVTNSSSTMEFLDFTEAKEAVDDLNYDDDYQPIERGCQLFDDAIPLFDFCAFARTMSAYTLYAGLFVLLGYMMYRFFMSDNNAT